MEAELELEMDREMVWGPALELGSESELAQESGSESGAGICMWVSLSIWMRIWICFYEHRLYWGDA